MQARRQGGGGGCDGCQRTPRGPGTVCLEGSKVELTKKKRTPKMNPFFWFVNAGSSSQCRKLTRGCWSLQTVFMILIYLPRPINSHNTIVRKGRLAVVFLGSIFPKSLLTEPLYLLTLRSFDIFTSNNTHRLLVASTTSCRSRAQNNGRPERSTSVRNEELTGQTFNVAFMLNGQFFENT